MRNKSLVRIPHPQRLPRRQRMAKFHAVRGEHGILHDPEACFAYIRELPERHAQLSLF